MLSLFAQFLLPLSSYLEEQSAEIDKSNDSRSFSADRGYFSFDLAHFIDKMHAFFIFRLKENFIFEVIHALAITTQKHKMPLCFKSVKDEVVDRTLF